MKFDEKYKINGLHNIFARFNKYIVLTCSLIVWNIIPIIGIIILLIYCQINISKSQNIQGKKIFLNLLPLILIIFTISTYIASFEPFNDTEIYINIYKSLKDEPTFIIPDIGMEPISFLLSKYISELTGGDEVSFLLFQSLTINTAFTIYARIFFPDFYPLIILINLTSQGYYYQLFWMRQFYSFMFVIPAVYIESSIFICILIVLGYYTHRSSLIYITPIFIASCKNIFSKAANIFFKIFGIKNTPINPRFLIISCTIVLIFFSGQIMNFMLELIKILSSFYLFPSSLAKRIEIYAGDSSALLNQDVFTVRNQLRTIFDYVIIFVYLINANYKKFDKIFLRWVFLFIMILTLYIASYTFGFSLRVSSIFFCLPGFFYSIAFYTIRLDENNNVSKYLIIGIIIFRAVYFFVSLFISYGNEGYLTFWDGKPLSTPITDYFNLFLRGLEGLF